MRLHALGRCCIFLATTHIPGDAAMLTQARMTASALAHTAHKIERRELQLTATCHDTKGKCGPMGSLSVPLIEYTLCRTHEKAPRHKV